MRETRILMGMPITVDVRGEASRAIEDTFAYFGEVDARFSTYKDESEIMRINRGEISREESSPEMQEVFAIADDTKKATDGYFNMRHPSGIIDPSGIVKGWAIRNAALNLERLGFEHFYIDAGGDIASKGLNAEGKPWSVGIRNPFEVREIVKVIYPEGSGVATSGSYIRGPHIYDPHLPARALDTVVSITVIGPDVLEADRYATAAFAMGEQGIAFIEQMPGLEGYSIDRAGIATMTSGFSKFL